MASSSLLQPSVPATPTPGRRNARAVLFGLFAIYLVLLTWLVVWKLELPHAGYGAVRSIKLIPFVPAAGAGASDPAEVVANIAIFVPFGIYLCLLAPRLSWWGAAFTFAVGSVALEAAQYVLAVGSADISDPIANVAGGLVGTAFFAMARRRLRRRTAAVLKRICAIGTVAALLAVGIFLASPVRLTQPDVGVDSSHIPGGA